jgi:hypothetical protein
MPATVSERVHFRVIVMPCCQHMLCWVNPRLPSHCPECGTLVYPTVRGCVSFSDERAMLKHKRDSEVKKEEGSG